MILSYINQIRDNKFISENISQWKSGVSTIEIVLILVVMIGLAYVFKNQISGVASGIYVSIKQQVGEF